MPNVDSPFLRPHAKPRRPSALVGACALALWLCSGLAACSQGRGEPCQVDRDCDDGLVCVRGRAEHGTCEPEGSQTGGEDAALPMDAGGGGQDASALEPDAGDGDAAVPMDSGPDDMDGGA